MSHKTPFKAQDGTLLVDGQNRLMDGINNGNLVLVLVKDEAADGVPQLLCQVFQEPSEEVLKMLEAVIAGYKDALKKGIQ